MSDFTIFLCDFCRIAVPIPSAAKPIWEAKHSHGDGEDDE